MILAAVDFLRRFDHVIDKDLGMEFSVHTGGIDAARRAIPRRPRRLVTEADGSAEMGAVGA